MQYSLLLSSSLSPTFLRVSFLRFLHSSPPRTSLMFKIFPFPSFSCVCLNVIYTSQCCQTKISNVQQSKMSFSFCFMCEWENITFYAIYFSCFQLLLLLMFDSFYAYADAYHTHIALARLILIILFLLLTLTYEYTRTVCLRWKRFNFIFFLLSLSLLLTSFR